MRARVAGARAFCLREGGAPASMCILLSTPHADEIESVYTTPLARGRGRAFAVVARAAREAGEHLTFLFTDADGAAQRLYGRLGFRAAGVVHRFSRPPGSLTRMPFETAVEQWQAGLRRLEDGAVRRAPRARARDAPGAGRAAPPARLDLHHRGARRALRPRHGLGVRRRDRHRAEAPFAWDVRVVGDAAFARYVRDAADFAGGLRRS